MNLPVILHIESSTNVCSVALSCGESCLFSIMDDHGLNHAALLSLFIQDALDVLKEKKLNLDAVAVSSGPGSYTGLRIGVSTAKGLCFGYDIPLIAIDTLAVMAYSASRVDTEFENPIYCPMIDARRMEVYVAFYNKKCEIIRPVSADIIEVGSYDQLLNDYTIYFFGNGAEKCKNVLLHPHTHFIDNIVPLAQNMIPFANKMFCDKHFVDTAYYEPFYLKEFQPTIPKNQLKQS